MKRNGMIATLVTLGAATVLYAGQGMGPGDCGDGRGAGPAHETMPRQAAAAGMMKGHGHGPMQGQKMHRKHKGPMQRMMRTIHKELNLTPEQRRQIKGIMSEYREAMQRQRKERIRARRGQGTPGRRMGMDASRFMTVQRFDKAAFTQTMERRWQMQEKRRAERRKVRLERMANTLEKVFAVLTPEQRQKLIELSQKRMGGK